MKNDSPLAGESFFISFFNHYLSIFPLVPRMNRYISRKIPVSWNVFNKINRSGPSIIPTNPSRLKPAYIVSKVISGLIPWLDDNTFGLISRSEEYTSELQYRFDIV